MNYTIFLITLLLAVGSCRELAASTDTFCVGEVAWFWSEKRGAVHGTIKAIHPKERTVIVDTIWSTWKIPIDKLYKKAGCLTKEDKKCKYNDS